jgi:hypothetical protein
MLLLENGITTRMQHVTKMKGSILKSNSGQEFVLTMVQLIGTHATPKNIGSICKYISFARKH